MSKGRRAKGKGKKRVPEFTKATTKSHQLLKSITMNK